MVRLGEPLSKDELDDIIQDAKVDRDGRINYTGISYERNPVFRVSDTNQPVQSQKKAKMLKFRIQEE